MSARHSDVKISKPLDYLQAQGVEASPHEQTRPGSFGAMVLSRSNAGLTGRNIVQFHLDEAVQRREGGSDGGVDVHEAAGRGVSGASQALPYQEQLQQSFGRHDLSGVEAFVGGEARAANEQMGAVAYATGNKVAFREAPDLHTVAHEVAHVVQQRAGVSLKGGVGESGDRYERHADAVADAVLRGESAEALLDEFAGEGAGARASVQKREAPTESGQGEAPGGATEAGFEERLREARGAGAAQAKEVAQRLAQEAPRSLLGRLEGEAKAKLAQARASQPRGEEVSRPAGPQCECGGSCGRCASGAKAGGAVQHKLSSSSVVQFNRGDCTDARHRVLQDAVNAACKNRGPTRCAMNDDCATLQAKMAIHQECANARATINSECFQGGDDGHQRALESARNGHARCQQIFQARCQGGGQQTQPVPVPAPQEQSDESFMEYMERVTGLAGTALIIYIIISEGSRILFPPRNFAPIP